MRIETLAEGVTLYERDCRDMNRPVSHLNPCVPPMAVRAQEAKIAFVGRPIPETVTPSSGVFCLFASVDVVDVKHPIISFSAFHADSAKLGHKGNLPAPVAGVFVDGVAVLVPVIDAALLRAKAMLASLVATLTGSLPFPSRREVTGLVAVFPSAVFQAVKVSFKRLFAVAADDCNSALFHGLNIPLSKRKVNFDIAVKRISDALKQPDFFIEKPKPVKQEVML